MCQILNVRFRAVLKIDQLENESFQINTVFKFEIH